MSFPPKENFLDETLTSNHSQSYGSIIYAGLAILAVAILSTRPLLAVHPKVLMG